jgi:signal peptidase I
MTVTTAPSSATASAAPKAAPAKRRGPIYWIGLAVSAVLLLSVLAVAVMVIAVPALTRSTPYTILTGSMDPTYPPGTLVIVKPTDPQQIKLGDVVTYQLKSGEGAVVTHRVVKIIAPSAATDNQERFITKGDANDVADQAAVRPVQIRGVVWYAVPYIGWVNNVVNGDMRPVIIPIVAGGLFLYAGWMMFSGLLDRRRGRRTAAHPIAVAGVPTPDLREDPAEGVAAEELLGEELPVEAVAATTPAPKRELERTGSRRTRFMPPED